METTCYLITDQKITKMFKVLVYVLYCSGLRQCLLMRNHTIFSLYFIQWEPENSRIGELPVDLKYDFENSNEHEKTANVNRHIVFYQNIVYIKLFKCRLPTTQF